MNDESKRKTRKFRADKQYIVFPRARGHEGTDKVFVEVDGEMYMSVYDAPLAAKEPDFYTFLNLRCIQGKEIAVTIEGPSADGVNLVRVTDEVPCRYPLYHEPGRPQVHFSPIRGWLNDPSGMIYFRGKWHLYYANTRFANRMAGANNAWGHVVSTDLLHWEELPIFLTPVREACSFWTGGAAVDVNNTTGLGQPGKPALVFSANNGRDAPNAFTQCVFVSTDEGMTCITNPEMMYKPLPKENNRRGGGTRDPMILWYAPEKKWVMVVYNQPPDGERSFFFFESKDLKNWTETSVLEDMYECPNLFELPVDGDSNKRRWVTWGSRTEYMIGQFDGVSFTPDIQRKFRTHYGRFSASQVFANAPGRRIVQIGWAHCCDYDREFSQMASFPLELSLRRTSDGIRLFAEFIPELKTLRMEGWLNENLALESGRSFKVGDTSQPMEIVVEFEPQNASAVTLTGADLAINWDARKQEIEVHGERVRLTPEHGFVRLHVLLDIPSVEVVTNHGESYIIERRNHIKIRPEVPLEIAARGGDFRLHRLEVYPLRPIHT